MLPAVVAMMAMMAAASIHRCDTFAVHCDDTFSSVASGVLLPDNTAHGEQPWQ